MQHFQPNLAVHPPLGVRGQGPEHKAERHARDFSSWTQLIAMLFGQLGHAQSLREITGGLAACEGNCSTLGVNEPPKRSTLFYCQRAPSQGRSVFYRLLEHCRGEAAGHKHKFRFKHRLLSVDSTTVALSLSLFDWAQYKRSKGAVKFLARASTTLRKEEQPRYSDIQFRSGEGAQIRACLTSNGYGIRGSSWRSLRSR
jgi:hypothetical protein